MVSESLELFSIEFLKTLINENKDENIFYSPLSIMAAFSMLLLGTNNQSSEQLKKALQYKNTTDIVHKKFSVLLEKCDTPENPYDNTQLKIANGLFTQQNYKVKTNYQCDLQNLYKTEVKEVNFSSPTAAKEINQWIENKTNNKIKDMFQDNSFTSLTRLVLANAIYFKSNFKDAFNEHQTSEKSFHKDSHTEMKIKMMHTGGDYDFAEDANVGIKVLGIPFKNYHLRLLLILPTKRFGLVPAINKLKEKDFKNLISSMSLRHISKLEVPKFKIDTEMDLKYLMGLLGVTDVFDPDKADLKGISDENLSVDKAIHKTFLDVNEHGVEAAAATAMSICCMSMPIFVDETPIDFIVDEPFLLCVYNNTADAIVFLGRVNDPRLK